MDFTIKDDVIGIIEKCFEDKKNIGSLVNIISRYADKNSNILLTTDMSKRLVFQESDKNNIYELIGIEPSIIDAAVKKSSVIKSSFVVQSNPFYITCVLLMHNFKDNKELLEAISIYFGYILYSKSHITSFKFLPNKEIMDYTINNLSNRFLLKQVGTIQRMIEETIMNAMDGRFKTEIGRCADEDIKDIISALDTRIGSVVKNIAKEFYANHKNGKYLMHEDDDESEENFHISDSKSYKIDRIVDNTVSSIVRDGFDQNNIIKRAINLNPGSSAKKLEPMLRTITEDDQKTLPGFITDILSIYLYKSPTNTTNDIPTMKFLSEALQIYKSNSQDKITERVKTTLTKWIDMTSNKYGRNFISKGKTSMDTYRRSIYTCIVFKIIECAK